MLEFSTMISGPYCGQLLGDLGADVIKVERPTGDPGRYAGGPYREPGFSAFFAHFNRNKRSLAVDLGQAAGRDAVRRVAEGCDVLVSNFRPGVMERLGLGYESLRAKNPGLVYVAITGFGPDGPYAHLPAYDHVIQGISGMMPVQGDGTAPRLVQGAVADKTTAMTAANAAVAALLARERGDGSGQLVQVPMIDAYAAFALPETLIPDTFPPLPGDPIDISDVFRTWETADGHVVGLLIEDGQFRGLCQALDRESVAEDERFSDITKRFLNMKALIAELEGEMRKWPTAEFVARAREFGAPFAPANDLAAFRADPQVAHRGTVQELEDPRFGPTRYLKPAVDYAATPSGLHRHPPRLGEHSEEVLRESGLSDEEVAALRESQAIR